MTADHVTAVNDSYRAGFVGLADLLPDGETRRFGRVSAVSAGLPVPEYNRVFAFEPPRRDEFEAAVSWVKGHELPFWVTLTPPVVEALEGFPAAFELEKSHEVPGMVLGSLDELPPPKPLADVSTVGDGAALDEFVTVFASVFDRPEDLTARVYRRLVPDEATELFVGRVDDRAVACGVLSRTDAVAGVYAIGVVEEYRRRGLGELMTGEVLRAGRDAGCQVGALQSTEVARPLYESMGFETVVTYHQFEPTARPGER